MATSNGSRIPKHNNVRWSRRERDVRLSREARCAGDSCTAIGARTRNGFARPTETISRCRRPYANRQRVRNQCANRRVGVSKVFACATPLVEQRCFREPFVSRYRMILEPDVAKRATMIQVNNHQWVKRNTDTEHRSRLK